MIKKCELIDLTCILSSPVRSRKIDEPSIGSDAFTYLDWGGSSLYLTFKAAKVEALGDGRSWLPRW